VDWISEVTSKFIFVLKRRNQRKLRVRWRAFHQNGLKLLTDASKTSTPKIPLFELLNKHVISLVTYAWRPHIRRQDWTIPLQHSWLNLFMECTKNDSGNPELVAPTTIYRLTLSTEILVCRRCFHRLLLSRPLKIKTLKEKICQMELWI